MKKINFCYLGLLLFISFACNEDAFLTMPESEITDCKTIYEELSNIRIDKIGKARYKYAMVDGTERLVEIVDSASYNTVYYTYQNNRLHSIRIYDRLTEATTSLAEYVYNDGSVSRINHLSIMGNVLSGYTTYNRDEQERIIESNFIWINNGIEALVIQDVFEWDDCNLIKSYTYDKNGILGRTANFFYDDKINPDNLLPNLRVSTNQSSNNLVRIEPMDSNDPNYLHGSSLNNRIIEYTYTYNEFNLPIRRRWGVFEKLDYNYIID